MNKKGSAIDVLFIAVFLFVFAISFFIIHYSFGQTADRMINNSQFNQSQSAVTVMQDMKNLTNRFDGLIFALLMGFLIALLITSWLVSGHPIFMFLFLLVDIIIVVVAAVLSFVWGTVSNMSIFGTLATTNFPITKHIFDNFPIYTGIIALVSLFIMYAKPFLVGER